MARWIVSRSGHHRANQPAGIAPETLAVAIVEAESAEEAMNLALRRTSCFRGQVLTAELAKPGAASEGGAPASAPPASMGPSWKPDELVQITDDDQDDDQGGADDQGPELGAR